MLTAVFPIFLLTSMLISVVKGHSQILCTDLQLDQNGQPSGCRGWPNQNRQYWYATNTPDWPLNNTNWKLPILGQIPPVNMMATVTPGQKIHFLNTVNNHHDDLMGLYREPVGPRSVSITSPLSKIGDWMNDNNLIQPPTKLYNEPNCAKVKQADTTPLGQMIIQHEKDESGINMSEDIVCWQEFTVPADWESGIHRVLYFGNRKADNAAFLVNPSMWFYWDVLYFNVAKTSAAKALLRPSLYPVNFPVTIAKAPFHGFTYTRVFLTYRYSTPRPANINVQFFSGATVIGSGVTNLNAGSGTVEISGFAELTNVPSFDVVAQMQDAASNLIMASLQKRTIKVL